MRIATFGNATRCKGIQLLREPITAKNELFLISSAIVGPTLIEDIIPIVFSELPFTKFISDPIW